MASIVLIHGACHGAWCWEQVTPILESQGHVVAAPDLPGMGGDRTPHQDITLDLWAHAVITVAQRLPAPRLLVGHSRGGIVISQAAEYAPDVFDRLVYVAAMLGKDGETLFSTAAKGTKPAAPIQVSEDGHSYIINADYAQATLYNRTPKDLAEKAISRLGPEPRQPSITPLKLSAAKYHTVPRSYIGCTHDVAINVGLQRIMLAETPCEQMIMMETDHSPFYGAPGELAGHLDALAGLTRTR
jgi:pimeloyl-ACP methyl ester carboxylesterase